MDHCCWLSALRALVDLAALADKSWDIEIVMLDGGLDGLSHGCEIWSFTHRRGHPRGSSGLRGCSMRDNRTVRDMRYMRCIYGPGNCHRRLYLISRGSSRVGDGRLRRSDDAVLALGHIV